MRNELITEELRTGRADKAQILERLLIADHLTLDCVPSLLSGISKVLGINSIVFRGIHTGAVVQQFQDLRLAVGFHHKSSSVRLIKCLEITNSTFKKKI